MLGKKKKSWNREIADGLREFISLIEREEFFEAHEILEAVWHKSRVVNHPERLLLKGLINGAIAFEHIKRGRRNSLKSSQITMGSYMRYRDICKPSIKNFQLFREACRAIESHRYKKIINK